MVIARMMKLTAAADDEAEAAATLKEAATAINALAVTSVRQESSSAFSAGIHNVAKAGKMR